MKLQRIELNKDCKPFFIEHGKSKHKVTGVTLYYKSLWSSKEISKDVYPTDSIVIYNYPNTYNDNFYTKFYNESGQYIGSELSEQISKYLRTQELTGLL